MRVALHCVVHAPDVGGGDLAQERADDPASQRWRSLIGQFVDQVTATAAGPAEMAPPDSWELTRRRHATPAPWR